VATPASNHFETGMEALKAGKHIFVEKPLALRSSECRDLIDLAGSNGRILMVGHTFEYNPAVRKVKDYLNAGALGEIYYIYSQRLNLGQVRRDVNVFWNLAPHDISIALYWLEEEPEAVSAKGVSVLQKGIEDVVFLHMKFPSGRSVHIHTSWLDPNKIRKMTVVGSKKMVVYDDTLADARVQLFDKGVDRKNMSENLGEYDNYGKFQLIHRAGDLLIPKVDAAEPLRLECAHFVDCLTTGKKPQTDGENGLRVVKILEAGQASLDQNGIEVPIK
jgi:predicted dehydrogenase